MKAFGWSVIVLLCSMVFAAFVAPREAHASEMHEHERHYYCVTACVSNVNENNCGDDAGLTNTCTSYADAGISNTENVATEPPASQPAGFLGCSAHDCDALCSSSGVTDADPIKYMSDSKTWCIEKDKTMFSHADKARMSALARGCTGSHAHGSMHMHGDTHEECASDEDHSDHSSSSSPSSSGTTTFLFSLVSAIAVALM